MKRARCGDCRAPLREARFRFCASCATRERLCQHCCRTTLTTEEQEAAAFYRRWFDSYRKVVKTYGIRSAEAAAHLEGCEDKELRAHLAGLTIREIDWPGAKVA